MKNSYSSFLNLSVKYFNEYYKDYTDKISNSVDLKKISVHHHFMNNLLQVEKIFIQNILGQKFRIIYELEEEYGVDSSLSQEDIFNQKIEKYPINEHKKLIENLAKYDSIIKFYDFISKDSLYAINTIESNKLPTNITGIKWRGKTEIDFIHLVYALHASGFLQNENKQVTNLVEELAKLFDFKLSKSWKQNHNSNINNTASDYRPRIFKELEESYIEYREKK